MSNGITWMFSEKGGYLPASNHAEIAEYTKSGFVPCGNPVDHKNGVSEPKPLNEDSPGDFHPVHPNDSTLLDEISRDELIKLADESNIKIDKRWNVDKLKQALGL